MFAILENGSVETMLRYRLRFSTGRAFAIPTGQSKTRMTVMTLRSCARTFIAGRTMSIIESLLVLWRLVARAKQSAPSGGNGRRVISVDRPLRLRTAPRERPGCSPASLPPEGTSWPFSRCTDARTLPGSAAGALPRRAFCTCKRKRNQKGAGEGGRPEQAKNPERGAKKMSRRAKKQAGRSKFSSPRSVSP